MTQLKSSNSNSSSNSTQAIEDLIQTIHRLRAPEGCPWDRAQTHQSLRQYLIEEAYEVLDVLDQIHTQENLKEEPVRLSFREELGDLLMQVLLHSEIAKEEGAFDIYDVAQALNEKLIRRHPHVFGDQKAHSADHALQKWEKEKAKEKASRDPQDPQASVLSGVPKNLPSLQRAARVIQKVSQVGFQWKEIQGPLEKIEEELSEFRTEVLEFEKLRTQESSEAAVSEAKKKVESELGDLFFSFCNIAFLMKINPEDALRSTLKKFETRFQHVERRLKEMGKTPETSNLAEMDPLWDEAKAVERVQVWGLTGGVAAGKSAVAKIFSDFGIPIIDADEIARSISQEGGIAHRALLERFGTSDRKELRRLIFSDPQAKKDIEGILHPLIQVESQNRIKKLAQNHSVIIYEAALLVETGRFKTLAGLIVIEAPTELRLQRLKSRDKIDQEAALKMIQGQTSEAERRKHAQFIFENSGNLNDLKAQVQEFIQKQGWLNGSSQQ